MIGVRVGGDEADAHVAMGRALDPARREYPVRITINQQRQHHARMILRLAVTTPIHFESADINPLDSRRDEMHKVVFANPIAKIGRQQKRLTTVVRYEIYHATSIN